MRAASEQYRGVPVGHTLKPDSRPSSKRAVRSSTSITLHVSVFHGTRGLNKCSLLKDVQEELTLNMAKRDVSETDRAPLSLHSAARSLTEKIGERYTFKHMQPR